MFTASICSLNWSSTEFFQLNKIKIWIVHRRDGRVIHGPAGDRVRAAADLGVVAEPVATCISFKMEGVGQDTKKCFFFLWNDKKYLSAEVGRLISIEDSWGAQFQDFLASSKSLLPRNTFLIFLFFIRSSVLRFWMPSRLYWNHSN